MSTLVAPRSRAAARVNRISADLDRSSGYLLGSLSSNVLPSSSSIRRARESSLTSEHIRSRVTSDTTTSSVRMRDSSLTRGGRPNATESVRNSVVIPSSFETAKYNREQEMKEIHLNFMKQYDTTKKKLNDEPQVEDKERKSKAYQRIINDEPPRYLDEKEAKKACVSEMFMDTSKFSTKTLSAINGLDGAVLRKKDKAYNWRKEMDDYEKRTEFERDVRARNVSALHRNDPEEDHWAVNQRKSEDRKRTSRDTIERPIEKAAKKEQESEVVKSWREKREAERATEEISEPEPERQSWRDKLAEKQKQGKKQEEEEKKQKEADAVATAATVAEAKQRALAAAADATADSSAKSAEPTADGEKTAEDEDEDENGTKQLKKDVGFLFSGLEQEFEESKTARAKLRERIKKVKQDIKEADDAEATENGETVTKESEAEKDKRRAELREKFRLQREAKKKAKAEAGQ